MAPDYSARKGTALGEVLLITGASLQAIGFLLAFLDVRAIRRAAGADRRRTQIVEVGAAIDLIPAPPGETTEQRLNKLERRMQLLFETAAEKGAAAERRLVREVTHLRQLLGPAVGALWRRNLALICF